MKRLIFLLALLPLQAFSWNYTTYAQISEDLKAQLHDAMAQSHHPIGATLDEAYLNARVILFGQMYLQHNNSGYFIQDVYCHEIFTSRDGVGQNRVPNGNIINCEHTWPQSRFNHNEPIVLQKADLHHLFPTQNMANGLRSSYQFGVVVRPKKSSCEGAVLGSDNSGNIVFEPPLDHKGNVARALFYFAVRYNMHISKAEEAALRAWDKMDPVDTDELVKNSYIETVQGNRNVFIDDPTLIDRILDI